MYSESFKWREAICHPGQFAPTWLPIFGNSVKRAISLTISQDMNYNKLILHKATILELLKRIERITTDNQSIWACLRSNNVRQFKIKPASKCLKKITTVKIELSTLADWFVRWTCKPLCQVKPISFAFFSRYLSVHKTSQNLGEAWTLSTNQLWVKLYLNCPFKIVLTLNNTRSLICHETKKRNQRRFLKSLSVVEKLWAWKGFSCALYSNLALCLMVI